MCLVYHTLFADETTPTPKSDAHLYGHVIDSKTGEHLPYATVTIPGTTIGTMTDASGHYFLKNLPTGTITVEARMMSYLTENDANTTSPALVDDCAICHFHFFSYIHSTDWVLDSEFRLLETFFRPECYDPAIVAISGSQLRAPPAIG